MQQNRDLSTIVDPTEKQRQCWRALKDPYVNEVFYGGAAGGGKSYIGCAWGVYLSLRYPGIRGVIGREELKTLKETTLNTLYEVLKRYGLKNGVDYKFNQTSGQFTFSNGSEILLKELKYQPSDPNVDALGSLEITWAFVDECPQIVEKVWDILRSRIRYKLTDYNLTPKILGAGNPAKNWVYRRFYKPHKEKTIQRSRQFIVALATDNPHLSPHYIATLESLDKVTRQRLLKGNFEYDDDEAALIEYDRIVELFNPEAEATGADYLTIDVARLGKDKTVIYRWKGFVVVEIAEIPKGTITSQAEAITRIMKRWNIAPSATVADEDGVGGGLVDMLRCRGFVNNSSPLETKSAKYLDTPKENYANLKSQCYFKLAERINAGGMSIAAPMSPEQRDALVEEMEQVKRHNLEKDGKLQVVPKELVKEALGRSPDYSDALMMREYFELKPKRSLYLAS